MPTVSGLVTSYTVAVESTTGGKVSMSLRLALVPTPGSPVSNLVLTFLDAVAEDFILFGEQFVEVSLNASAFASTYEILRTERPVYAAAQEIHLLGRTRRRFVLSTDPEPLGEGDVDASRSGAPPVGPGPDPSPFNQP